MTSHKPQPWKYCAILLVWLLTPLRPLSASSDCCGGGSGGGCPEKSAMILKWELYSSGAAGSVSAGPVSASVDENGSKTYEYDPKTGKATITTVSNSGVSTQTVNPICIEEGKTYDATVTANAMYTAQDCADGGNYSGGPGTEPSTGSVNFSITWAPCGGESGSFSLSASASCYTGTSSSKMAVEPSACSEGSPPAACPAARDPLQDA